MFSVKSPEFSSSSPWERLINPGVPGLQETLLYHFVPARLQSGQLETHVAQRLRTFEGKDVYIESFRGKLGLGGDERFLRVQGLGCKV